MKCILYMMQTYTRQRRGSMRKKKLRKITVAIDALLIDASIRQYDLRRDMCNMITRNLRDIDRYALSADCDKALGYNEAQLENFFMSATKDGSRIVISSKEFHCKEDDKGQKHYSIKVSRKTCERLQAIEKAIEKLENV